MFGLFIEFVILSIDDVLFKLMCKVEIFKYVNLININIE